MRESQSPKTVRPTSRGRNRQYVVVTNSSARLARECGANNPSNPRSIFFAGRLARMFGEAC